MSFLGSIGSVFQRVGLGIVTGGTSELARLVAPGLVKTAEGALFPTNLSDAVTTAALAAGVSPVALGGVAKGSTFLAGSNVFIGPNMGKVLPPPPPGYVPNSTISAAPTSGGNMAFNLSNLLGGVVSGIGSLVGGGSPSQALQNFTSQAFLPTPTPPAIGASPFGGQAYPTMASVPAAARAVATVGRSFFAKYPNLATYIQQYRNMGKNVTRAKLWSLLKRFGPEIIVSGGILSAAAVSELMTAGPGRRRMNPANVKALRRSLRRLESFHHLCVRVDKLRSHRGRGRSRTGARGATQQFVRQG
jgi:hypothetical protein